jgi:hypothetical protein
MTRTMGKLNSGIPQVPTSPTLVHPELISERKSLPIFLHRDEIIDNIMHNQVNKQRPNYVTAKLT